MQGKRSVLGVRSLMWYKGDPRCGWKAKSQVRKGIPTGKVYCTQMREGGERLSTQGHPWLVCYHFELQTCRAIHSFTHSTNTHCRELSYMLEMQHGSLITSCTMASVKLKFPWRSGTYQKMYVHTVSHFLDSKSLEFDTSSPETQASPVAQR